jgi:hypothetical protein
MFAIFLVVFLQPGEEFLPLLNVALVRIATRNTSIHRTCAIFLDKASLFLNRLRGLTFNQPKKSDVTIFRPILV